jgi:protein O-mannosyl-transferase
MKARRNRRPGKPVPVPPPPAGGVRRWQDQPLVAGAVLFFLTCLVYLPALHGGFIWDDEIMVTKSEVIKSAAGLHAIWCTTLLPDYFPLTSSSLWLEWRLWGMNPLGYHLTNILLHAGSVVLLWRGLRLLAVPHAWLVAAIFAVHPVNVESVAWIAERKNTLAMFFYAATLLGFLKFGDTARRRWYGLALAAFVLALLSKTSVAPLPLVLLLCVWWRNRRITWRDVGHVIPFFAAAAVFSWVTIWFQNHRAIGGDVVQTAGLAGRLATAGCAVWFYLYKALLPVNLMFIYPRWNIDPRLLGWFLPAAALAVGFAASWQSRRSWGRPVLFGLGYFVVMLLPVLGFFNIYFQIYSLVADHWQYFSLIGAVALAVAAVAGRLPAAGKGWFGRGLAVAVLMTLSALTWSQAGIYISNEAVWRDTLAKNPGCWVAYGNLGLLLKDQGDLTAAETNFRLGLKHNPDFGMACDYLGIILMGTGRTDEAVRYLRRAVALNYDLGAAHNDLGIALAQQGQFDEAFVHFQESVRHKPGNAIAHNSLGNILVLHQEYAAAVPEYETALRLNARYAEAHNGLGYALEKLGQENEALAHYQEAAQIQPDYVQVHLNLASLLAKTGQRDGAVTQFQEVLRLDPGNAKATAGLQQLTGRPGR